MSFSVAKQILTYPSMVDVLGPSPSQVHASVCRLLVSGLPNGEGLKGKVDREALANSSLFEAELLVRNNAATMIWPQAIWLRFPPSKS